MTKTLPIALIFALSLGFGACLPEENIKIYPPHATTNVPVNAIVTISINALAHIDQDSIKDNFFQLTTCPKETEKTKDPQKKKDNDEKIEPEVKGKSIGVMIQKIEVDQTNKDGENQGVGLLVYLLPEPEANSNTPLMPNTQYCVHVKSFKNKNQKIIQGIQTSFTTESVEGFLFHEDAFTNGLDQNSISAKGGDYVFLDLKEKSVSPQKLKNNLTVCEKNETEKDQSGLCKGYGTSIKFDLFVFENLIRRKQDKTAVATFSLYAIQPKEISEATPELKIILDPQLTNAKDTDLETIEHIVKITTQKQGDQILKEINDQSEEFYFKAFKVEG